MADIVGTGGNDILPGTGDADTITALAGNDTVNAGDGADIINGGTGNDTLNGEDGDDTFIEDTFTSSQDVFNGGGGFDTIELRAAPLPLQTIFGSLTPHTLTTSMTSIERLVFASQPGQVVQATLGVTTWESSGLTQIVGGAGRDFLTISTGLPFGTFTMPNLPLSNWDALPTNAWQYTGDVVVLSSSAGSFDSVTLNALAGASFFQILAGGRSSDFLNGSENADSIDVSAGGGDTVNAGGGNDSIILTNSRSPTGTTWNPPSTQTGAGGTWDGGAGTDVITIGGAVNLQATLLNIEGINLLPAFASTPNVALYEAAVLTLDSAHIAMLPSNAFVSGVGTIILNIDDGLSFSTASYEVLPGSDITTILNAGDGDGLTFSAGTEGITINLGQGTQTGNGGDGDDVISTGFGTALFTLNGGNGDDILVLDNFAANNNALLNGGADDDLIQLFANGMTPTTHSAVSTGGGGVSGVEGVQFATQAGQQLTFIADWNAGFSAVIGGQGFDRLIFNITSAGTYTMPGFSLVNWNAPADWVGMGVVSSSTFAVTLNGRNDINQYLFGGQAADTLNGGALDDWLFGVAGADSLNGNAGNDIFYVVNGATGASYNGGIGTDTLVFAGGVASIGGLSSIEAIQFLSAGSALSVTGTQLAGLASNAALSGNGTLVINMDAPGSVLTKTFIYSGSVAVVVNGSTGSDILKLGDTANTVNTSDGTDQVKGGNLVDTINGGLGVDKINGAGGADILTGGGGNDVFKYARATDSGLGAAADRITDYAIGGDRMNFAAIDTNAGLAGDQGFSFVGSSAFSGGGVASIRYADSGADLLVQADVNGDGVADMEIILQGLAGGTLTAADFVL